MTVSSLLSAGDARPGFDVAPRVAVFVGPSIAVVVSARLASGSTPLVRSTAWGAAAGLAYDLPVHPRVSLFPSVEVGYERTDFEPGERWPASLLLVPFRDDWELRASLPVLFHVVPHLFFGGGPRVSRDLTRDFDGQRTRLSLFADFGAWL
ncbi:hypothetical protein L6R52_05900 [Myxococcota bacterium]|nr:hypothetical protein [Myxococcota bacterium]